MVCQTIYSINALTLLLAYENPAFAKVLERADITLADGVGAVWALARMTGKKPERVPGVDLIIDLVRVCAVEKQRVFLLGGRPGVARRCAEQLQHKFPELKVAGIRDGYWLPETEQHVVAAINAAQVDLLLVGLGQPAQEVFLDKYHQYLQVRVAMGVGGSFDVLSGDLKRAPRWMQGCGLEWLFRLLQDPRRLGMILRLPRFVCLVLRAKNKKPK
ncbi:WecB/TagA/CpsF family glycosyltransferase [bacterium]|nr:WecB/TagA/CpsF family glycosyltransferase [bacterium]